jgi:hypothetical protein
VHLPGRYTSWKRARGRLPSRTTARDHLGKADAITIAAIERGVPTLAEARTIIDRFHATIIRTKAADDLDPWIADASASLITSFATGIAKDKAAVRGAIFERCSNGQTEGQITKTQVGEAPDVRNGENRPSAGPPDRRSLTPPSHHRKCVRAKFERRLTREESRSREGAGASAAATLLFAFHHRTSIWWAADSR